MICAYTNWHTVARSAVAILFLLVNTGAWGQLYHAFQLPGQARFRVHLRDGHLVAAAAAGTPVLSDCFDEYWLENEQGQIIARSTEAHDRVTKTRRSKNRLEMECHNAQLGITLSKVYTPSSVAGGLRKTVTVRAASRKGLLHVFSRVRLAMTFASRALLYTPRQSWAGPKPLFGVRPLAEITAPLTSSTGWDNRFVVAFQRRRSWAIAHWQSTVDGMWVPASGVITEWTKESPVALTYLPDGWRWRLLLCVDGKSTSGAADYVLFRGDWYDAWRVYRQMPEYRAAYAHLENMPSWCRKVKYGTFWQPPFYQDFADSVKRLCERLGPDAYLTIGVFAWSLDGDYVTDRPFLMETLLLAMTPDYLRAAVAALQSHPRAKVGLYIQGALIDSESECYRNHPDWVIRASDGKPIDSGFKDNPVGSMYMANFALEEWLQHHLARVQDVARSYNCSYIYLDGGGYGESVDWARRQHVNFAHCRRLNERLFRTVRAVGTERGLLINSQNAPFADMSWLESGYFNPQVPWRETVDFCFDTECQSDPRYTLLPLFWVDNDRYLAMCIAFGFTPCGDVSAEKPEATWRAIEAAYEMKSAQLIYNSAATSPVWWRDGVPVVTFAKRRGKEVVVPILNFSTAEQVEVTVDLDAVGFEKARLSQATIYQPLLAADVTVVQPARVRGRKLTFRLTVPVSWRGITLLTLK